MILCLLKKNEDVRIEIITQRNVGYVYVMLSMFQNLIFLDRWPNDCVHCRCFYE